MERKKEKHRSSDSLAQLLQNHFRNKGLRFGYKSFGRDTRNAKYDEYEE